jgi:hypothetical protein
MVDVLIEEMVESDWSRPTDYERAVVVEAVKKRIRPLAGVKIVVCFKTGKGGKKFQEKPKKGLDRADIVRDGRLPC